jgi:hypothetical protein
MHDARKRRSAVHLFTSGFHSRNCIRADMPRAVMHKCNDVLFIGEVAGCTPGAVASGRLKCIHNLLWGYF